MATGFLEVNGGSVTSSSAVGDCEVLSCRSVSILKDELLRLISKAIFSCVIESRVLMTNDLDEIHPFVGQLEMT